MTYTKDTIIVGGGIAGLYCAYKINQVNPSQTILIIESDKELGGRIRTHYEKQFQIEKGAARFSQNHTELLKLIGEFGLTDDLCPIPNEKNFIYQKKKISYKLEDKFQDLLKKGLEKPTEYLVKVTLYQLCVDLYGSEEADKIQALSGYDAEFIRLNAYAALHMFKDDMLGDDPYYVLKSGLSELIKRMESKIKESSSVEILFGTEVTEIQNRRIVARTGDKEHKFSSLVIICAVPYLSLRKLPIFQELDILHSVKPISLCRIYVKYPMVNGKPWFHGMTKTTTDNYLRYIIPMSDGVIMYYADLYVADLWRNWSNVSDEKLTEMLHKELHQVLPGKKIPKPLKIKVCHWKAGVHAWRPNYNFQKISKQMIQPFHNDIYVAGECYSTKQDWIEGSLITGNMVLAKLGIISAKRGSKKKKSLKKSPK